MLRRIHPAWLGLSLWLGMGMPSLKAAGPCAVPGYQVGAAQDDITGPIAEVGMMGYANLSQVDDGLHMRLRSRSLVISNACGQDSIAMVISDLAMIYHGLKQSVLERLDRELPGVFNHRNLLFSATHTHAGPGGFAHHALYNITTLGFSPANFEAIAAGTVRSLVKAYRQREAAKLLVDEGELTGIQYNRSPSAYEANSDLEKSLYPQNSDPSMVQLKAVALDGRPLASFNWFAVHGVSLPMENTLVSGDNKGLAAYKFETSMGTTYRQDREFIAGFVQSNAGDISPYDVATPPPADIDGYPRNDQSAEAQYEKARTLFQNAREEIQGPLAAIHSFVDVAYHPVDARYTGQGPQRTCNAALGVSFAAGTENGRPVGLFHEGTVYGVDWPKITIMPQEQSCQAEKVILLPTGFVKPNPWTARIAPFQMLRLGQLVVVATPFEITTMAGRRLKKTILETMAPAGVKYVVISALANEYLHYVTTREEYATQHYEGGSTLYGPWSLAAYTEIFNDLSVALRDGKAVNPGPLPRDLSSKQLVLKPGVIFDAAPIGKKFGDVKQDAGAAYAAGERIDVQFWGAHPNNSLFGKNLSLLQVQKWTDQGWQTIRYDWDADTFYRWKREGLAQSAITLSWATTAQTPAGRYRLCQSGHSKEFLARRLVPYEGCSRTFVLASAPITYHNQF